MDIKTLSLKIFLFTIPFIFFAVFVILMDPYNLFCVSDIITYDIKLKKGSMLNLCLWKSIEFKSKPNDKIILGDSRTYALKADQIKKITGEDYFNFGYDGGSLPEAIDTFWFAVKHVRLSKVYIGLNFNVYNANYSRNRFKEAENILENKALYFINNSVIKSIFFNLESQIFNSKDVSVAGTDKDKFWKHQLGDYTRSLYFIYSHPDHYLSELKKITQYCKANNIKLAFIIYPTHVDLQHKVSEYNLIVAEKIFKSDLLSLGSVYDFDYPNAFTIDKDNFNDPYHYKNSQFIVDGVWGNNMKYPINAQ